MRGVRALMPHLWPPATYIDEDGPPLTFQALAARTTAPATRPAPRGAPTHRRQRSHATRWGGVSLRAADPHATPLAAGHVHRRRRPPAHVSSACRPHHHACHPSPHHHGWGGVGSGGLLVFTTTCNESKLNAARKKPGRPPGYSFGTTRAKTRRYGLGLVKTKSVTSRVWARSPKRVPRRGPRFF